MANPSTNGLVERARIVNRNPIEHEGTRSWEPVIPIDCGTTTVGTSQKGKFVTYTCMYCAVFNHLVATGSCSAEEVVASVGESRLHLGQCLALLIVGSG